MASVSAAPDPRSARVFEPHEILLSLAFSAGVIISFFMLLVVAGENAARVRAAEPPKPAAIPISVKPVLDEVPLLKLGGKKVRPKLPDMWKKNPPVQRKEAQSAPSPKAAKTPEAATSVPLAKPDAGPPPPPDAEVAKEVDQVLLDAGAEPVPQVEGEGSPDGVKEGTETDPLKARAQSAYLAKIIAWFDSRFRPPSATEIPCAELTKLSAAVTAVIGGDRRVTGYSVTRPSGNAIFDERVKSTMDRIVGEELPPPPPLYPELLNTSVTPRFSGSKAQCE